MLRLLALRICLTLSLLVLFAATTLAETATVTAKPAVWQSATSASGEGPNLGAAAPSLFKQASVPEIIATPANMQNQFQQQPTYAPQQQQQPPQNGNFGPAVTGYDGNLPVAMPPLNIPSTALKCCQEDNLGRTCEVDRYLNKPTHLDPNCLVCVKEPYIDTETVKEQTEVVIQRCFEAKVPFKQDGCEDGTWYKKEGDKIIRRLRPCTTTVNLSYEKQVVKYRDVWYHVRCD